MTAIALPKLSFAPAGDRILLLTWSSDADPKIVDAARDLIRGLDDRDTPRKLRPLSEGHVIQLFNNRNADGMVKALGLDANSDPKAGALGDTIILSSDSDNDTKILEKKRQIALLDQARPQVALNGTI